MSLQFNRKTFTASAWLTMISAFATIPMAYLAITMEGRNDSVGTLTQVGLQVVGTLLFVAITLILKRFLNRLFVFHDTDKSINLMVITDIVTGVVLLTGIFFPELHGSTTKGALALMVFQGLVQLRFGYKLLRLHNNLGGMLKPFCCLNMAEGLCVASVVLIVPGIVFSAVSDLMLATIFFKVAQELKGVDLRRPGTE